MVCARAVHMPTLEPFSYLSKSGLGRVSNDLGSHIWKSLIWLLCEEFFKNSSLRIPSEYSQYSPAMHSHAQDCACILHIGFLSSLKNEFLFICISLNLSSSLLVHECGTKIPWKCMYSQSFTYTVLQHGFLYCTLKFN